VVAKGTALATDLNPEGLSKGVSWLITGGGTIVSLLIGWWLYGQASRRSGGAAAVPAGDW
jgi:hypothetical protein